MIKCALCGKTLDETNNGTAIHSAAGCILTGLGAWDGNWFKINAAIEAANKDGFAQLTAAAVKVSNSFDCECGLSPCECGIDDLNSALEKHGARGES